MFLIALAHHNRQSVTQSPNHFPPCVVKNKVSLIIVFLIHFSPTYPPPFSSDDGECLRACQIGDLNLLERGFEYVRSHRLELGMCKTRAWSS